MNYPVTPNSLWNITRKFLAVLLGILFSLALALALLTGALSGMLDNEENVLKLAEEIHLAERGRVVVANLLVSLFADASAQASSAESSNFVSSLPAQSWQSVAEYLIPVPYMEENLERLLNLALAWFSDPQADLPELLLDLSAVRQALQGPTGVQAILPLLQNVPDCQGENVSVTYFQDGVISCLPQGYNLSYFAGRAANLIAESTPAQIQLNDYLSPQVITYLERTRQGIWTLHSGAVFFQRLSLLLLALYGLLYSASPQHLLQAAPRPLYAAASLSLLLVLALKGVLAWGIDLLALSSLPGLSAELQLLLTDLLRSLGGQVTAVWLRGTLITLAAAIILHGLSFGLERFLQNQKTLAAREIPLERQIKKQFR